MKNFFALTGLSFILLLSACEKDDTPTPNPEPNPAKSDIEAIIDDAPVDPYQVARELISQSSWPLEEEVDIESGTGEQAFLNYEREVIADDIVHYFFQVQMGDNPNDKIGIHRVVREMSPNQPIKNARGFFFQHGDAKDFRGMMLPGTNSPTTSNDFGMAVYLARNDIDVWGIDQAWTLTPAEVTDHSFMADWGLQKQVTDLRQAMAVARIARFLTGSGLDPFILAGYSSGVTTGFTALNEETQLASEVRHVDGYIPLDLAIKTDDETWLAFWQGYYAQVKSVYESGEFAETVPFQPLGQLARNNPNGDSEFIPGFTNLQAALFMGIGPIFEVVPFHYLAGEWENNLPAGVQYLTNDQWLDFMISAPPYQSRLFIVEYTELLGDVNDLPFDDYFADITVPILNISPAGGFGESTKYGTTLMGSSDVTHLITKLESEENVLLDFAHIDIFIADNAESLIWQPMLEWVNTH